MQFARCCRCGRPRSSDDLLDPHLRGAPSSIDFDLQDQAAHVWATLDGADVCPDCQTEPERQEVRHRIVDSIERTVEQAIEQSSAPIPGEAAIIDLAMKLRDEAPPPPAGENK